MTTQLSLVNAVHQSCLPDQTSCDLTRKSSIEMGESFRFPLDQHKLPLQEIFRKMATTISSQSVDLRYDQLNPNETDVRRNAANFLIDQPFIIIAVGTERVFFNLIMAAQQSPGKCRGLVARDINPEVKKFIDFVVLLLIVSDNIKEFHGFANLLDLESIATTTEEIRCRLHSRDLAEYQKDYYKSNLDALATVYYIKSSREWRENTTGFIDYHQDQMAFRILQDYARSGSIIATTGAIDQLRFLEEIQRTGFSARFPLLVIDASNAREYTPLIMQLPSQSRIAKLIETRSSSTTNLDDVIAMLRRAILQNQPVPISSIPLHVPLFFSFATTWTHDEEQLPQSTA